METFFKGLFTSFLGLTSLYSVNIQPNTNFTPSPHQKILDPLLIARSSFFWNLPPPLKNAGCAPAYIAALRPFLIKDAPGHFSGRKVRHVPAYTIHKKAPRTCSLHQTPSHNLHCTVCNQLTLQVCEYSIGSVSPFSKLENS